MTTDAVILAAGYSSRANAFKMELDIEGKAVLQHVIEAFLPICNQIIVVGGYQVEKLYPLIQKYEDKVVLVWNREFKKGMFSSVRVGIAKVEADRFFLTPGDCAMISTNLCNAIKECKERRIIPTYQGRGGHPILLGSECIPEILKEPEESNLKYYLNKKEVYRLEMEDDSILYDIDTEEDYKRIKNLLSEKGERP